MNRLKIIGVGLGAVMILALFIGVWEVWFADPPVDLMTVGPAVRIDTRFLGEYFVAASLIEVSGSDGNPVFRATSSTSDCRSDLFVFVAGANDVPELASRSCAVEVPQDSATFNLKAGEAYTFTVVGNSPLGHVRKSSRRFTVPSMIGRVSPSNR